MYIQTQTYIYTYKQYYVLGVVFDSPILSPSFLLSMMMNQVVMTNANMTTMTNTSTNLPASPIKLMEMATRL